jgi:low affinity Fe/Cu permease
MANDWHEPCIVLAVIFVATRASGGTNMSKWFSHFASRAAHWAGHYLAFLAAVLVIVIWAATGPFFKFSSTWQLVINTGTTIITFLMVFLIQNSQNRDAMAMHLKLDELLRAVTEADDEMMSAEDDDEKQLRKLKEDYMKLSEEHKRLRDQLESKKIAAQ